MSSPPKTLRIASFDIGKKNFAFYAEDCSVKILKRCRDLLNSHPKKLHRYTAGAMNPIVSKIFRDLFKSSARVKNGMGVFDLRHNKDSNDLDIQTRSNMYDLLKQYEWLWNTCDVILFEQQFTGSFRGKKKGQSIEANFDAIKLGECCMCWFIEKYYPFKHLIIFSSTFKTQILGAPLKMTKPQRKKWSIEKGKEILRLRGDLKGLEELEGKKNAKGKKQKLDDILDCLNMTQAFKYKTFVLGR